MFVIVVGTFTSCTATAPESDEAGDSAGRIVTMQFRPLPNSSSLLGKRVDDRQGKCSFRPPADWDPVDSGNAALGSPHGFMPRMRFRNQASGDFADIGGLEEAPAEIDEEYLIDSRNSIEKTLRAAKSGTLLGVDLFKFRETFIIQTMTKNRKSVVLQLLLFGKGGRAAQITFSVGIARYHALARTIEGSIASFEWLPSLPL